MVEFCSYSHRNWVLSSVQWRVNSQHIQVYTISKYRSIIITYPLALMLFNQPLNLDVFLLLCSQKQLILNIDNQNYYSYYTKRFHLACDNDIYEARRHNKDEYGRHLKVKCSHSNHDSKSYKSLSLGGWTGLSWGLELLITKAAKILLSLQTKQWKHTPFFRG